MPVIARNNKADFEQPPVGVVQAVCAFVEDIGTHQSEYNGKPIIKHQVIVCWELSEKMTKDDRAGTPFTMSKFYTLSLSEKANLRKDLESWRGKAFTDEELDGFDLEKLIGANCLLNLVADKKRDGSDTVKILAIMPLTKGTPKINKINTIAPKWIDELRAKSMEANDMDQTTQDQGFAPTSELPF